MYKRVLLKLSGEALAGKDSIFDNDSFAKVAKEIKKIVEDGIAVGVVIGGGNIYRGKTGLEFGMDRVTGDTIGMLATALNGLTMQHALETIGVKAKVLSSFPIGSVCKEFSVERANKYLAKNIVCIYVGGTGHPYFTTDTCAALRALETNCDALLIAKNKVDGVYDQDPKNNPNAKKLDKLKYVDLIERNLLVLDHTAIILCKENKLPVVIFNMNNVENINKVAHGEIMGTVIGE